MPRSAFSAIYMARKHPPKRAGTRPRTRALWRGYVPGLTSRLPEAALDCKQPNPSAAMHWIKR
jgi:hypothetical protein